MLFTTPLYNSRKLPWKLPEKDILSIDKNKDQILVTATLVGKRTRITDSDDLVGLGHVSTGSSSVVLVSLLVKNVTFKVVSGDNTADNPKSEAAKP
jgi:hypothetical protein